MTGFALALVLVSAVTHATWNLLAKRSGADTAFLFVVYVVGAVAYAPFAIAIVVLAMPALGPLALGFVAVSVLLQTVYFATLTAGYRAGDLSLVYPLARATGPLLATAGAIAIFGERPTPTALAGALAIAVGAVVLAGDPRALRRGGAGRAAGFALATGVVIALYTLWDKTAVSTLLIPPLLYDWATVVGQALVVAPVAVRRAAAVRATWAARKGDVIAVGLLSRLSYILALTALAVSPVAYVAPAREIGILIGALLGARLLAEGHTLRRGLGAAAMVLGVVALAVG
ncbi:MAG: EamA family transporter [Actinobacteria bacterium]|nr:MAG: EamA family transporter [Actinomycetota bacterium]